MTSPDLDTILIFIIACLVSIPLMTIKGCVHQREVTRCYETTKQMECFK